jgi:hypothetical protein
MESPMTSQTNICAASTGGSKVRGTYATKTTPISSPTTPRVGGTLITYKTTPVSSPTTPCREGTPITYVKPQKSKMKPPPAAAKTGTCKKPQRSIKTLVVDVDTLPRRIVHPSSSRTSTNSTIRTNYFTRTRDQYK